VKYEKRRIKDQERNHQKNSLLLLAETKRFGDIAQAQTLEELVNTKATKQATHKSAQAKSIKQTADKTQNSTEQQANRGDDLEQGLAEKRPQRVQLLLRVWHVLDTLSAVVYRLDDGLSKFLQQVC
jgi:hypothetical protein